MVQLYDPSLGVLEDSVWTTDDPFNTSIFRYDPTVPEVVQVMACVDPGTQDSPPLGEVIVNVPVGGGGVVPMVK